MAHGNLYKDFRAPRTPTENANIGRNFRIKERMNLQIRGEFVNIFNRTIMPAPSNVQSAGRGFEECAGDLYRWVRRHQRLYRAEHHSARPGAPLPDGTARAR